MSEQKDFEALGRYVDAKERASSLETARHNLSGDISRMLGNAATGSSSWVRRFDHEGFMEKAEQLVACNLDLEAAIAEVNSYAKQAGKPDIKRG